MDADAVSAYCDSALSLEVCEGWSGDTWSCWNAAFSNCCTSISSGAAVPPAVLATWAVPLWLWRELGAAAWEGPDCVWCELGWEGGCVFCECEERGCEWWDDARWSSSSCRRSSSNTPPFSASDINWSCSPPLLSLSCLRPETKHKYTLYCTFTSAYTYHHSITMINH